MKIVSDSSSVPSRPIHALVNFPRRALSCQTRPAASVQRFSQFGRKFCFRAAGFKYANPGINFCRCVSDVRGQFSSGGRRTNLHTNGSAWKTASPKHHYEYRTCNAARGVTFFPWKWCRRLISEMLTRFQRRLATCSSLAGQKGPFHFWTVYGGRLVRSGITSVQIYARIQFQMGRKIWCSRSKRRHYSPGDLISKMLHTKQRTLQIPRSFGGWMWAKQLRVTLRWENVEHRVLCGGAGIRPNLWRQSSIAKLFLADFGNRHCIRFVVLL